ncbi:MAG: Cof-type HAD-IIB family hydrolase [Actinomycetota bacterium]|nr:Cof-type HAD-IIB family hydrolase [Actinomycetota bacterium]
MTFSGESPVGLRSGIDMAWQPKLVATDLDGTFLDSAARVSVRNAAALARLRSEGIPVVGVTGRAPRLLHTVEEYFGGEGIVVLAQGAFVGDLATGEVLRQETMPSALALDITAQIEAVTGPLLYAGEYPVDGKHVLYVEPGFAWPYNEGLQVVVRADLPADGLALKFYLCSAVHEQDSLLVMARSVVPREHAELTHAGLGFIELCPPGVTKATGLAVALERYGVDRSDVLVFGDMPNDLPMFGWAGRAVAVANAHPDVLAVADDITGTNDEDGFADYLDRLLWTDPPSAAVQVPRI